MQRLTWFTIEFIVCFLLFIILNNIFLIDTIYLVIFCISTFFYIFTFEELPKAEHISHPQVHYYQRSRINYYGNSMLMLLILLSLLYFVLTTKFPEIRLGLDVLILWLVMIIATFFITKISQKEIMIDIITDYIARFGDSKLQIKQIRDIVKFLYENKDAKDINKNFKNLYYNVNKLEFEKVRKIYDNYIQLTLTPLNSDEIRALDSNKL